MPTKMDQLKAAAFAQDWPLALRIAARFPRLGEEAIAIRRANDCLTGRASFYRQIGRDPDLLVAEGIDALRQRWRLG